MLKKSNAMPYTSIERMNIHTPSPGFPHPNNANRSTQQSMAMSMTYFMPKRFRANGMSNRQRVSDSCESEINTLAWRTPNVSAYSGILAKLLRKGLANPLVICKATPISTEKTKNKAIFRCLNKVKAFRPRASTKDFFSCFRVTGQGGKVKAYPAANTPSKALMKNWLALAWKPSTSVAIIEQMKPTVPYKRMEGKLFMGSSPTPSSAA